MRLIPYLILSLFLLAGAFALTPAEIRSIEDITIFTEEKSFVDNEKAYISQTPHTLSPGEVGRISFEARLDAETYTICFDFKGQHRFVRISEFGHRAFFGLIYRNLVDENIHNGMHCMKSIDAPNRILDLQIIYDGMGSLKYDIFVPELNLTLDPYIIGNLTGNFHIDFNNNNYDKINNATTSYVYTDELISAFPFSVKKNAQNHWGNVTLTFEGTHTINASGLYMDEDTYAEIPFNFISYWVDGNYNSTCVDVVEIEGVSSGGLNDGLVSYWKFDETSGIFFADSVGSNTATASNSRVLNTDGKINKGADFTKGNDVITLSNDASLNFGTNDFTLSFWIKDSYGGNDEYKFLLSKRLNSGNFAQYSITKGNPFTGNGIASEQLGFIFLGSEGGSYIGRTDNDIFIDNNWKHIVIIRDALKSIKIYVNNELQDITITSTTGSGLDLTNTNNLFIGGNSDLSSYFDGLIDEPAIYSRALTSQEVEDLFDLQKDGYTTGQPPWGTESYNATVINNIGNTCPSIQNIFFYNKELNSSELDRLDNRGGIYGENPQGVANEAQVMDGNDLIVADFQDVVSYSVWYESAPDTWLHLINNNGTCYRDLSAASCSPSPINKGTILSIGADLDGRISEFISFNTTLTANQREILYGGFNRSVYLTFRDESTGAIIENVTGQYFYNQDDIGSFSTTDGTFFMQGFLAEQYTFSISAEGYMPRNYLIDLRTDWGHESIVYLSGGASNVIFTFQDSVRSTPLSGVEIRMSRTIENQWQTVESRITDITGRSQFTFSEGDRYRFIAEKDGYITKEFILDPILFTSYTVKMDPEISLENSVAGLGLYVDFSPKSFQFNQTGNITFVINSPANVLNNYSLTITYGAQKDVYSGTNPSGEVFVHEYSLTEEGVDYIIISYTYNSDVSGDKSFSYPYRITGATKGQTLEELRQNAWGIGLFERVLIAVVGALVVAGIVSFVAGFAAGGAAGLFILGIMAYIVLIPWWAIFISLIVGFFLLIKGVNN